MSVVSLKWKLILDHCKMSGHPVVAQAHDDLSTSSEPTVRSVHSLHAPQGDLTSSSQETQHRNVGINLPGQYRAFYSQLLPEDRQTGSHVEVLSANRLLDDLHIGKVSSQATKRLNNDLMEAADFTDSERQEIQQCEERSRACAEILSIWRGRDGLRKTVFDLCELLKKAGGQEDRCRSLIQIILNSPP